jgi:hypothetical protein
LAKLLVCDLQVYAEFEGSVILDLLFGKSAARECCGDCGRFEVAGSR